MSDGFVWRLNQIEYDAAAERRAHSALLLPGGPGAFSARAGRRPGGGLAVTTATVGTSLVARVTPGSGVIYDAAFASAGPYVFEVPAQKEIPLGERPGSGTSRIALVVVRVNDPDVGAGPGRGLTVEVVPGEAGPNPSKPSLPDLSLELATVTIPATGNPSVTPSTARTVAAGGVLPVTTDTERLALPSPTPGMAVYVEANDSLWTYSGSRWSRYAAVTEGTYSVSAEYWEVRHSLLWEKIGRSVTVYGAVDSTGAAIAVGNTLSLQGDLPAPARSYGGVLRLGETATVNIWLQANRTISFRGINGPTSQTVFLDGLSYQSAS